MGGSRRVRKVGVEVIVPKRSIGLIDGRGLYGRGQTFERSISEALPLIGRKE